MRTQTIPQNQWPLFFDSFSRRHEGWLIDLEVFGTDVGAQVEEHQMTMEGITAENEGTNFTISLMAGTRRDSHLTHTIDSPTEVSLELTDEGATAALAIKSADGQTSLLRFRSPMLPEMVDGLVS
jgi:hypothetical protein